MAKGDAITVVVEASGEDRWTLTASKAGRSVTQSTRPRTRPIWLDLTEVTRTGRSTGNTMAFRLAAVKAIIVKTLDVPAAPAKPRQRKAAQPTLNLDDPWANLTPTETPVESAAT